MKKFLSVILSLVIIAQIFILPAYAEDSLKVFDTVDYAFISEAGGMGESKDAVFNVPDGKAVASLSLNGETIKEGDGKTRWDNYPSTVKNYVYDAEKGTLSLSRRYIGVDLDLYGERSLDFILEFTDGTRGILRLNGVYNYPKLPSTPLIYSENNPSGYRVNEIIPNENWAFSSSNVLTNILNFFDGKTNQFHSYYVAESSLIMFRDALPHYIDIDTGAKTEISGVLYKPRTQNTTGSFTSVLYQGSNDGVNFTDIKAVTFKGTLDTKITKFPENVSYRYYRIKVLDSISGYSVGDELHLLKPFIKLSDTSIDIAEDFNASFNLGSGVNNVISVIADEKDVSSESYNFDGGVFTFTEDYIKNLSFGEHKMEIYLDNAYTEFNLYIEDSANDLRIAKENAKNELNSYGLEVATYISSIENADSPNAVEKILDDAAEAFGAKTVKLPYNHTFFVSDGEVLSSFVSKEGLDLYDKSAITYEDGIITASGIGRALVKSKDKYYIIKTEKAKIALVLISGQSNAAGDSSDYTQSPSALGDYKGRYLVTNSMNCSLPLTGVSWEEAKYTAEHGGVPSSEFINSTWSEKGWSAAAANQLAARLSDEWGMTIWAVNTGICARIMDDFDPSSPTHNAYNHTINYVNKVKELIQDDPHYILDEDKTGLFWLQGCSDGINTASENTMEEYTSMFLNMYNGWKEAIGINYAGIWLVRAGVNNNGDKDFYMSGPRLSQHYMGNSDSEELKNIYLILNTDIWRTDEGVNDYFSEKYPDKEAFFKYYGYDRPSTYAEVKPDLHHRQKGYNELGDAAGDVLADILTSGNAVPECAALLGFEGNEIPIEGFSLQKNETVVAVPVSTTTYFNASFNLTVSVDNEAIASFDNDTFTLKGVSEGKTVARIKYNGKVLASYPVVVSGVLNEILSDRSKWTISASSVEGTRGNPDHLVDGSTKTSFVADIKIKTPPHHFEILLPEATLISGFGFDSYTDANGYPLTYEIYGADTLDGEYKLINSGSFDRTKDALALKSQAVYFDKNVTVRKIKFVFVSTVNNYAAMSEFYLYPEKTFLQKGDVNGDRVIDTKDVSALIRYVARWVSSDAEINLDSSDVNDDGKVNLLDAIIIARSLENWPGFTLSK